MGASNTPARNRFTSNALPGEARFRHQTPQRFGHAIRPFPLQEPGYVGAGDEHEVVLSGDPGAQRPESLSQRALNGISLYGAADLAAHRDAEPRPVGADFLASPRKGVQDEKPFGVGASLAVDAVEVAAARQAPSLAPPARRAGAHGGSRLRPLRRLRLMICRPLRVCMRARNP